MSGISSVLNIARGALFAQEESMAVIGHNIANVNTPGYSRQSVLLSSSATSSPERIKIGMGVQVDSVYQYTDPFSTRSINQTTTSLKGSESQSTILSQMETIFNESSDNGLNKLMSDFWNSWQDLANNPGGNAERTALLEKGQVLAKRFNSMSDDLSQLQYSMNDNIKGALNEVNSYSKQIAEINSKIVLAESSGSKANDLRDQRSVLVGKLSELVGTVYLEDESGSMMVETSDGTPLVEKDHSWNLSQSGNNIYWNGVTSDISKRLKGGQIGAWLDVRDSTIPQYNANLDELAGTLIYQVNNLHYSGFGLNDTTGGKTFFTANAGDDYVTHTPGASFSGAASNIALSADVNGNPNNVAAAGQSGGDPNDNEMASKIIALQTDDSFQVRKWTYDNRGATVTNSLQTVTMDSYYNALVGDVGILSQQASQNQTFQQSLVDSLTKLRDSVSGVNLDEEMTNLLQVQQAYEAAGKLVKVADETLQSLLQLR
jgi:flagellar hook-associated protein 1 FlgK